MEILFLVVALGQDMPKLANGDLYEAHQACIEAADAWVYAQPSHLPKWAACMTQEQVNRFFDAQRAFMREHKA